MSFNDMYSAAGHSELSRGHGRPAQNVIAASAAAAAEQRARKEKTKKTEAKVEYERAREAAKKAAKEEIEAKKRAAAAASEALERAGIIKSAQAKEAAKIAAEKRAGVAAGASGASPRKIPTMEIVTVTSGQNDLKMKSRHGVGELHDRVEQGKEIVNVTNEKHMLGSNEEKVSYGKHETTINGSIKVDKPIYTYSMDQENRQIMKNVHQEDYLVKQSGAKPKDRTVKHSGHADSSQSVHITSQQNPTTAGQKEQPRHSSEKEIVTVTVDEKYISKEFRSPRSEDGMNQYVDPNNNPSTDTTQTVEHKQKNNQGFQNEHYPGDGKTKGVWKKHQPEDRHNYKDQQFHTYPTQRHSDIEHPHRQPTLQPFNRQKQSQYSSDNHHHRTQQQGQQRSPVNGSSRAMLCVSCNEKYNCKEKLPRNLRCGHSLCTPCIQRQIKPNSSVSCPHCQRSTCNIKNANCCPINDLLVQILSKETQQEGFMEEMSVRLQCSKSCQEPSSTLVFLDLSWGGQCHGRLYIRLSGDTLCGRQFLRLCVGEGENSFCGTRFHRVSWKDFPGEHVSIGDHEKGGGGGERHPPYREQLQIPAGREVLISAGLVAGRYQNNNLGSIFSIYTRGKKNMMDETSFGQVEFGLDVVQKAVRLPNIHEVLVSDCGLVLDM
ncbi:hypothetical protein GWK47_050926 [Chionoecetes opilio]|uniref:RING-type domain-containing protein n=1 Tax=Chionoecetes opilio TaxID=41210 RepID=A0A8J4Y170_CHIOP|nr:hypothetical protein GWK47_050926 [Chionoecetes opilio]